MDLATAFRKKILSLLLTAAVILTAVPIAHAAGETYSVRDAYMYFARTEPEFILNILESGYETGVTESLILRFMIGLQNNFYTTNRVTKVTDDNFEELFIDAVIKVSGASAYSDLQMAMYRAYPDASNALQHGRIHPSIAPLLETMKDMVLGHNMLSRREAMADFTFRAEEIIPLEKITVAQLDPLVLPESAYFRSESGLIIRFPVYWNDTVDTAYAGAAYVSSPVILPEGYEGSAGFGERIDINIDVIPISAGGTCGDNIEWTLENGVLTVSGSGAMYDYTDPDKVPWASVRDAVNEIVIESGVTSVGNNTFAGIKNLAGKAVCVPDTVRTIGDKAFEGTVLESAVLPSDLEKIGGGAFGGKGLTIYGGPVGGAADRYAHGCGADFVPDSWGLPSIISIVKDNGRIRVNSINISPGEARLAFYGSGMVLLAVQPVTDECMDIPNGARYTKAFLWDEGMVPLCKSRSLISL